MRPSSTSRMGGKSVANGQIDMNEDDLAALMSFPCFRFSNTLHLSRLSPLPELVLHRVN